MENTKMRQFSTLQLSIRQLTVATILIFAVCNLFSYHDSVARNPNNYYLQQNDILPRLRNPNSTTTNSNTSDYTHRKASSPAQKKYVDETTTEVVASNEGSTTTAKNTMPVTVSANKNENDIRLPKNTKTAEFREISKASRTLKSMRTDGTCPLLTDPSNVSVSLVIHATLERLWLMEETCRRWAGPIVLVVYYHPGSNDNNSFEQPWMQVLDWQTACPQVKLIPVQAAKNAKEWQYPVNKLRNIGLDSLDTPLFLMMDVDFLPSENLEEAIKRHFLSTSKYYSTTKKRQQQRIAMVVPAFERMKAKCDSVEECQKFLKHDSQFIPRTYPEIVQCVNLTNCNVFQESIFLDGHYTTGSEAWLKGHFYEKTTTPNSNIPRRISCFHSYRYEPYTVLQWCKGHTPLYDERFYGYGKNKIEYISHLRFLNYSFHVLPEGFLAHHPHKKSEAHSVFREKGNLPNDKSSHREKMDRVYSKFLLELKTKHGGSIINQCIRDAVYEQRVLERKKLKAAKAKS